MWLLRLRNFTILCLLICTGLGVTRQEEWNDSADAAEDSSADFFDYPLSKLLKQMKQIAREEEAEEVSESIKKKARKPLIIEPEAEMLPAHYTGVKPPGVDHMELAIADTKTANSDGEVYMISIKNKKNQPAKEGADKVHKKHFKVIKKRKSGRTPEGGEQSKQRENLTTVRNYVFEDVFEREGSSEGGDDPRAPEKRNYDDKL